LGRKRNKSLIKFSDTQGKAMDAIASEQYSFILFGGAMGGGKTIWGLAALLLMCEIFPKSRWVVIREDLEKIRTTTIPSFGKLRASGKLRTNPYEYTHPNGSVILFKGENYAGDKELNWMRGLECNGFLFEEINECQSDSLDIAFSRAGRWECEPRPAPIILATCNPSNNWIKTIVYDRFKDGTLPDSWLYIPSKITDNPHLPQNYIDNLKNMPRYKYEVLVEGNWDIQMKVGGEFYKCFELDKHVAECKYNPQLPLHISFDENVNPYLPLGIFQIIGKKIYCIGEIAGVTPLNTIKDVCNEFKRKYPVHTHGLFIYGDATSQKSDVKLERGHNFFRLIQEEMSSYRPSLRVSASNPSVAMRGNFINTVLESNFDGIEIVINIACKKMINDFVLTKEAADGTKNKEMETNSLTKVRYQKTGHFTDLFDYFICFAFMDSFARYQRGGKDSNVTLGKNLSKNTY
jgi:hypothetical protein